VNPLVAMKAVGVGTATHPAYTGVSGKVCPNISSSVIGDPIGTPGLLGSYVKYASVKCENRLCPANL
jgi:hypothetical protein